MSTRRAPCPICDRGPKDDALAITVDERGEVFYCHRCQYTGATNVRATVSELRAARPIPKGKLEAIWSRTQPLHGTLGETYLMHRRCVIPPATSDVRFLPGSERYAPSLCALVTDAITRAEMTLHFTPLRADGLGRFDKRLLKGHPKAGGVIRIWPDEGVTCGLGVAEGIETALSAAHAFTPVWAVVDAGNMAKIPVLDGIEALTIFADNDPAGLGAARVCGKRWANAGREVRIAAAKHGDINDAVAA